MAMRVSLSGHGINRVFFAPFVFASISFIGTALHFWESLDRLQDNVLNPNPLKDELFDFIIVGAGTAGAVLANRLSASHYSVLLLEAGGEPHFFNFIPALNFYLFNYPELDWSYKTVPQTRACQNSVNQRSSWNAGKNLGGSGNLNGMLHIRGHPLDFKLWSEITGDPSWSYEGTLPFFKRYEDYNVRGVQREYHGYGNELRIEAPEFEGLTREFIKGAQEMGVPHLDLNGYYTGEGVERIYFPIKNGFRQAPYKAFIEPIRKRRNLTIRKFAFVTKVLLSADNQAYGVEYDRHDKRVRALARKEVIVSAGTVSSTKLLMLSGIGNRAELERHDIPVRVELPTLGQNLQDHLSVYFGPVFINNPNEHPRSTIVLDRDITPETPLKYFLGRGRGVFSAPGATASALFSSSLAKARGEGDRPDIQLFMYGYSAFKSFPQVISRAYGLKVDDMEKYHRNSVGRENVYVAISGARPFSRGSILLGGSSPYDDAIIDPRYLSDPGDTDFQVLKEGVNIALKLFENTTAFQKVGAQMTDIPLPGCEHLPFRSEVYWECYVRRYSVTLHHPCCTLPMGRKEDPRSIVDPQLRVKGTKGLRVIDSSVMPIMVTVNSQATILMMAEKGADMILNYWSHKEGPVHHAPHSHSFFNGGTNFLNMNFIQLFNSMFF